MVIPMAGKPVLSVIHELSWNWSKGLSSFPHGPLVAWWLGPKSECPRKTRQKLSRFLCLSLGITSAIVIAPCRFKERKHKKYM